MAVLDILVEMLVRIERVAVAVVGTVVAGMVVVVAAAVDGIVVADAAAVDIAGIVAVGIVVVDIVAADNVAAVDIPVAEFDLDALLDMHHAHWHNIRLAYLHVAATGKLKRRRRKKTVEILS